MYHHTYSVIHSGAQFNLCLQLVNKTKIIRIKKHMHLLSQFYMLVLHSIPIVSSLIHICQTFFLYSICLHTLLKFNYMYLGINIIYFVSFEILNKFGLFMYQCTISITTYYTYDKILEGNNLPNKLRMYI